MGVRKHIAVSVLSLALIGGIAYWKMRPTTPKRRADLGEPQKSVDQILQERANQASGYLLTPIGKAFVARNWKEFRSLYQPKSQFHDLAEIVRALYIQNQFSSFSADDMDQVLKITYDTLERIDAKDQTKAMLLVTQFYRLPLPRKQSSTYQQLESWLGGNNEFLRRLATSKLVTQDVHPPEKAIKNFIAGFQAPPEGTSLSDWIRQTDEIRALSVRERCLKELFVVYPQLKGQDRSQALIVLGREPKLNPQSIAKYALDSLESEEQAAFEAGLRTIPNLLEANVLNSKQKDAVVKRLTQVPSQLKTPYVAAKIDDLLPKLSHPR